MKAFGVIFLVLMATGCTTGDIKQTPIAPEPQSQLHRLDLQEVQHDLDMEPPTSFVGYREKRFDACKMQSELPAITDCSNAYFIQLGLKIYCRPTEEPEGIALSESDLTPLANRDLVWKMADASSISGHLHTDLSGSGIILTIAQHSLRKKHLRVSTGKDYLIMTAGDVTQIETPVSWCR